MKQDLQRIGTCQKELLCPADRLRYSYQPLYLRGGIHTLNESELHELDRLAELLSEPDKNMEQIENLWTTNEKFSVLTNNTQNIYYDTFG